MASTPVASGSKVPHDLLVRVGAHLTLLTTAVDVMPAGLSTNNHPEISRPLRFLPIRPTVGLKVPPRSDRIQGQDVQCGLHPLRRL